MKKILFFWLLLLPAALLAGGRGVYTQYDFSAPRKDTPLPKGYKTVYVSYFGRHGSRYLTHEKEYDIIAGLLHGADLTPAGEQIRSCFDSLYPLLKGRGGDLSQPGRDQLYELGRRMAAKWPSLLRGRVEAVSSDVPRCILSMYSFLDGMREVRPRLTCFADVNSSMVPLLHRKAPVPANTDSLFAARFDAGALYARLFSDPDAARGLADPAQFVRSLFYYGCHLPGTGIPDSSFPRVFTEEEAAVLAEMDDWKFSHNSGWAEPLNVAGASPLLEEFLSTAEKDLAAGTPSVRLRFGHDNTLMALMSLLELGPFDASFFDSSVVPMAANVRWIFARNRKGDTLVKVQYNESDVTGWMPWPDFLEACRYRVAWAKDWLENRPRRHSEADRNTPSWPLWSGHRGLQPFGPENSFASFEAAAAHRCWAIETDFRNTADGQVVCMHDATLDRTTTGTGKVKDYTLEELRHLAIKEVNTAAAQRRYDYSSLTPRQVRIPTMEDYFRICRRSGCVAFIELKEDDGIIEKMNRDIEKYGLQGRCIVSSGNRKLLKAYRDSGGKERIHLIFAKMEDIPMLLELGNAALAFNYPDLNAPISLEYGGRKIESLGELVDLCHSLGLKICFRAVDNPQAERQSMELGLDYFPTNNMWNK